MNGILADVADNAQYIIAGQDTQKYKVSHRYDS